MPTTERMISQDHLDRLKQAIEKFTGDDDSIKIEGYKLRSLFTSHPQKESWEIYKIEAEDGSVAYCKIVDFPAKGALLAVDSFGDQFWAEKLISEGREDEKQYEEELRSDIIK
ncbi:MAG: hypothetical protein WCT19_04655 [Candidatus Paceibacterota bacterium]